MSALTTLDRWKRAGTIGEAQHTAIAALVRRDRFSLFIELNALLYLGVLSIAAGAGWTIATYSARLGDLAILATLTAVFGASLYYCFTHTAAYSQEQVEPPGLAFDYVLYLGCLIFAVELGYVESRFHPFGADWDQSLLLAAAVFFALAYRFDNRFVLSLALSSLGGWFGVRVSQIGHALAPGPVHVLLLSGSLRAYAIAYGVLVAGAGVALQRAGIKRHFLEAYLHVAANVLFLALLSGVGSRDEWPRYLLAVLALSTVAIVLGVRFSRFAFVAYGVVFGYAGVSARVLWNVESFSAGLAYFVVSGSLVILALVVVARRFGRDE
jgi:hypothetical protein